MSEIDYSYYYKNFHREDKLYYQNSDESIFQILKKGLDKNKSISILEIGCGTGLALHALRTHGYNNVVGYDIDPQQVAVATGHGLNALHLSIEDSLEWLGARAEEFDFIIAIDVFEHVEKQRLIEFLKLVNGAMKSEGTLLCRVPNCDSAVAQNFRYDDWTHEVQFSAKSLDFVLHNSGFSAIKVSDADQTPHARSVSSFLRRSAFVYLRSLLRGLRRIQMAAELGWPTAKAAILSPNIIAVAKK